MERPRRRLTVIVCLDVAGYSALVQQNELRTLAELGSIYKGIARPTLVKYGGRVIKTMGDGGLIEFESVHDAVEWTMMFQRAMARRNASTRHAPLQVRAAIALADIIITEEDRFGAAIGFAARLQEAAPLGGIAITHSVRWQLLGEPAASFQPAGFLTLRSIPYPVEAWFWAPEGVALPAVQPAPEQILAPGATGDDRPSDPRPLMVVLPFDNLTGDSACESIVDGVVEEITTTMSHLRDVRVVARNTANTFKGRHMDVRALVKDLGVRYVLEGSLRRGGDRLRVSSQLVDAETGVQLWSGRSDGSLTDVFGFQDETATAFAGALHPALRRAEIERAQRSASRGKAGAHDLVLRALPFFWAHQREDNATALRLLDEALAIDPRYGLALGLKGWCLSQQVTYLWSDNPARDKAFGLGFAERAAQTADPDPFVFTTIGATLSILQVDQARALVFIERALALDSTFAWAWTRQGYALAYSGRPREGLKSLERALSLSPEDPVLFNAHAGIATCHFLLGHDEEAVRWVQKSLHDRPGMVWANRLLATAAAHAGELDIARAAAQRLLEAHPDLTIRQVASAMHNIDGPCLDRYLHGLRLAGLPDEPSHAASNPAQAAPVLPFRAAA